MQKKEIFSQLVNQILYTLLEDCLKSLIIIQSSKEVKVFVMVQNTYIENTSIKSPTKLGSCISIIIFAILKFQTLFILYLTYKISSNNINKGMQSRIASSRMNTSMMGRGGIIKGSKEKHGTPEKKQRESFTKHYKKKNQFNPSQFMVAECSLRDIEIYKQVFDFLDEDHDGMLTPLDLRKAVRQYGGYNPGKQFVYVSMSVFDADDGGQISFRQFVKIMTQKPYESDTSQDLVRVFESIDQDNKGYIDEDDLRRLSQTMKEDVTLAEIRQTINHVDPNGQGVIRLQQFIHFSKRKNFD